MNPYLIGTLAIVILVGLIIGIVFAVRASKKSSNSPSPSYPPNPSGCVYDGKSCPSGKCGYIDNCGDSCDSKACSNGKCVEEMCCINSCTTGGVFVCNPDPDTCGGDCNACPYGKTCENGRCIAPKCSQDTDCGFFGQCVNGSCSPTPVCSLDSNCPTGYFCHHSGKCARLCSAMSDCPVNDLCYMGFPEKGGKLNQHCIEKCTTNDISKTESSYCDALFEDHSGAITCDVPTGLCLPGLGPPTPPPPTVCNPACGVLEQCVGGKCVPTSSCGIDPNCPTGYYCHHSGKCAKKCTELGAGTCPDSMDVCYTAPYESLYSGKCMPACTNTSPYVCPAGLANCSNTIPPLGGGLCY